MLTRLQKLVKKILNEKNTQTRIITLAAIVPGLLVFFTILSLLFPKIFRFVMPVIFVIVIALTIWLFLELVRFMKGLRLIDENAIILSQGNLNINDIISEKTKGLGILTSAINDLKRNLLSYIESTKNNVIILTDAVEKVTKSIDMTYKGNEQIAANMSVVAEKAQEQLKVAKSTLEGIEKVRIGADKITTTLGNIESFVETTVKVTSDGTESMNKYSDQMAVITTNLEETSNFIETLATNLTEINEFGKLIMNITGQLNLLSLNSRVEAARAGEAGRGFSIVAQEMNKLSDATKDSVTQINYLLGNIMKNNTKVSESITNVTDSFTMSKVIFDTLKTSFYTINNNANILNSDIKQVYEESLMISQSTKVISEQGAVLHDASNEISNITQDVAAVTEEELAENEEISTQAATLKNMLSGTRHLLKKYKTSVTPVEQENTKNLKFVMLGLNNSPFWLSVKQGALYAQTELRRKNTVVEFLEYDVTDPSSLEILRERIDSGCDGLILPGFIKGIEEYAKLANQKNIPVIAYNCDFTNDTPRLSYLGPNVDAEGAIAAEILARSIDGEGEIVVFKGDSNSSINIARKDSALSVLSKFKDIKIVAQVDDMEGSTPVYKKLKELIYYLPNVKGILFIGGGASGAAKLIEEMKLVGIIKLFCFNTDEEVLDLIRKGIVHKAFGQDPFGQGHDPIIYLYNYLVAKEVPESKTYTRTEVLDKFSVND